MSRISKTALAFVALSILTAPLALAGEVVVHDQWNLPVMISGAKGAPVQATQPGQFTNGVPAMSATGGSPAEALKGSQAWTAQPNARSAAPQNGSDWMNR